MNFFYLLARNISYSFAISFYTIISGWIIIALGFFLGSSYIVYSNEKFLVLLLKWLIPSMIIYSFVHFIHFGFLTPIKIPALQKSFRVINKSYSQKFKGDADNTALYHYFSDIPYNNFLITILYMLLFGAIIAGISFYDFKIKASLTLEELIILFKAMALSLVLIITLYSISSYLIAEYFTKNERSRLYNKLIKKGILIAPRTRIGLRGKFLFIIILFIIILLTFAAIMKHGGLFSKYNIYLVIAHFSLSIIAPLLLLIMITKSIMFILRDIKNITRQISYGEKTSINALSLEKEIADIEYALMGLAIEQNEYRDNQENKIMQKTTELLKKTNELHDVLSFLEEKDIQMQKQLDMASVIQRNTLPVNIESWYELKFAMKYNAMEQIGGDFYDVYQFKNNKLGIIIADVSGHGIPASLVTAVAKTTFNNARLNYDSPRKIFQEVNHNILQYIKSQDYMSCFMVVFDDEYNFVYSNASHQKAILLHGNSGEIELLDTEGLFIGALSNSSNSYQEKRGKLAYGDRLILYTDGIPEALNDDHKEYTNERLQKQVIENKNLSLNDFSDFIINDVYNHIGKSNIQDDMTLLVIELAFDDAVDIIRKSKKLVDSHKYYESIEVLEQGLSQFPENKNILYNLGKNYFRTNEFSKAIQVLEKYLEKDNHNKYAYYVSGATYFQLLEFDKAIEHFNYALRLDAHFSNALFALAMSYKKKGDNKEAIRLFEKVVSIDPANKMALFEIKQLNENLDSSS